MLRKEDLHDLELKYKSFVDLPKDLYFGTEIEFTKLRLGLIMEAFEKEKLYGWDVKEEVDTTSKAVNIPYTDLYNINSPEEYKMLEKKFYVGGEVSSPILRNVKKTWEELKKVLEIMKENNAKINEMCALQFSFDASILGNNQTAWINFLTLYTIYEPVIFNFTRGAFPKTRNHAFTRAYPVRNEYLLLLRDIKYLVHEEKPLEPLFYFKQRPKTTSLGLDKVCSYDFQKNNVIEFRSPNGTLSEEIIQNTFVFFTNLLLYCKSKDFDTDFINYKLKKLKVIKNIKTAYNKIWESEAMELMDLIYKKESDKIDFLLQFYNINLSKEGLEIKNVRK